MLDAIEALLTRHSVPAQKLTGPGPSQEQIEIAIDAALRAPDHGNLKPWRAALIRGEARQALANLFVRQMQSRDPPAPAGKIEKARTLPLSVPLVIAVGAHIRQEHKVPEVEQLLACGAATMNMMNALHAQGFAAIWLTGPNAYDPEIARLLEFSEDERCLGFIYVGTPATPSRHEPPQTSRGDYAREWSG